MVESGCSKLSRLTCEACSRNAPWMASTPTVMVRDDDDDDDEEKEEEEEDDGEGVMEVWWWPLESAAPVATPMPAIAEVMPSNKSSDKSSE